METNSFHRHLIFMTFSAKFAAHGLQGSMAAAFFVAFSWEFA